MNRKLHPITRFKMAAIPPLLFALSLFGPALLSAQAATNGTLAQIIAGARKEGTVVLSAPSTLTPRGAQALIDGVNKKWGLSLSVKYVASRDYPAIVSQLITENATGQPPSYDLVDMSDGNMTKLMKAGLLLKPKWTELFPFISKNSVRLRGETVAVANHFRAPTYNTNMLKPAQLPKSWLDLGNPKWKGKLLVPAYADIWAYLTREFGVKKVTRLVREIAANSPVFGRYGEIGTRLAAGEYPLAAYFHSSGITQLQRHGAPVKADIVDPIMVSSDLSAVVKGAPHPDAATLFAAFSLTPQGQKLWSRYGARSSATIPGTPEWKFLQGKKYVIQDPEWYEAHGIPLEKKYARILGLRK